MFLVFYLVTQMVKSQRVTADSDSDYTDDDCDDNASRDRGGSVANAHASGTDENFLMRVLHGNWGVRVAPGAIKCEAELTTAVAQIVHTFSKTKRYLVAQFRVTYSESGT
jgi:hypothetical protein